MSQNQPTTLAQFAPDSAFAASKRAVPGVKSRSSGVATHVAWAGGGFILGVVCWHMVGFWSFIDKVLEDPRPLAHAIVSADKDAGSEYLKTNARLLPYGGANDCVQHVESVVAATTVVHPCALPVVAMKQDVAAQ